MQSDTLEAEAPKGLKTAGIVAAVIAVGVVGAGVLTRHHEEGGAQTWSDARAIPTVHLIPVEKAAASTALTLPATTQAWNAANIFARVGGYMKAWYKDIGDRVGDGTALGSIDTPELDQQIIQARAALLRTKADASLAKSTAVRWNDLLSTNSVSHQEADEKNGALASRNAAVQAAEADLGRLIAMKGFATLRAPFPGVVTTRTAQIGDLVGPGATNQVPLFAIADVHKVRVYVSVPQVYAASMHNGLGATLTVPGYPGRSWRAELIGASGAVNNQTGTFQVQLLTDNPDAALKPGGYAQVKFDVPGQGGTVIIPSSSLLFRAEGTQVATVDGSGHVHLIKVAMGRDLGGSVEIQNGLNASMKIVDNPPDSIAEGELVRVGGNAKG